MMHRILSREEIKDVDYLPQNNDIFADMSTAERNLLLRVVKEQVPENGGIIEWGSGGSTILISENMLQTVGFISIEHNKAWFDKINVKLIKSPKVTYLHVLPENNWHAYGTIEEESPTCLTQYINTPENIEKIDLFFIDGVARNTILNRIFQKAKVGAYILLHDAYRSWYDEGLSHFKKIIQIESLILSVKEI